jgi:hypothetical protein
MLYMHSAGGPASAQALSSCLGERQPEVILEVQESGSQADSPLRHIIREQIERRGMSCRQGSLPEHWIHAAPGAPEVAYRLCAVPAPGG